MTYKAVLKTTLAIALGVSLSQCGAKPADYGYEVAVTLTPAALDAVKASGDKIVVDGYYYGQPVDAVKEKTNEKGQIELGEDMVSGDSTHLTVHASGVGMDLIAVQKIQDKPRVLITAYVPPVVDGKAVLSCTSVDDTIATAQAAPVKISCDVVK